MKLVKDLMIPLQDYTRVSEDASLYDAIIALENSLHARGDNPARPTDRAILVQARDGHVLGKLSLWDVLRGIEPRYERPIDPLVMIEDYFLWTHTLFVNLAGKTKEIKVTHLLREHADNEFIDEEAPIDMAIHQLVDGKLLSLLVTHGKGIVGILRLSDVFATVSTMLREEEGRAARV